MKCSCLGVICNCLHVWRTSSRHRWMMGGFMSGVILTSTDGSALKSRCKILAHYTWHARVLVQDVSLCGHLLLKTTMSQQLTLFGEFACKGSFSKDAGMDELGYATTSEAIWMVSPSTDKTQLFIEAQKTWMEIKDVTTAKQCQKSTAHISCVYLDVSGGGWVGQKKERLKDFSQ